MSKQLIILSLLFSMNIYADERNKLTFEIKNFVHLPTTNRITLTVKATATTTFDKIDYIKVANGYDVSCNNHPKNSYFHSSSGGQNVDGFVFFGSVVDVKANTTDGSSYATGYPMFDAWEALETQTHSEPCTVYYKGGAKYSTTRPKATINRFNVGFIGHLKLIDEIKEQRATDTTLMKPTLIISNQ